MDCIIAVFCGLILTKLVAFVCEFLLNCRSMRMFRSDNAGFSVCARWLEPVKTQRKRSSGVPLSEEMRDNGRECIVHGFIGSDGRVQEA